MMRIAMCSECIGNSDLRLRTTVQATTSREIDACLHVQPILVMVHISQTVSHVFMYNTTKRHIDDDGGEDGTDVICYTHET